jgi:hypothetical protein
LEKQDDLEKRKILRKEKNISNLERIHRSRRERRLSRLETSKKRPKRGVEESENYP